MRRLTRLVVVVAVALAAATLLAGCGGDAPAAAPATAAPLGSRTVEAGDVTVKLTAQRVGPEGAVIGVVLDTHSVELDLDVAANTSLIVDGVRWTDVTWDGPGPGGHHREGTLRFGPAGGAAGVAELTIHGLPGPVRATWTLEER